jgi:hypothetical protein
VYRCTETRGDPTTCVYAGVVAVADTVSLPPLPPVPQATLQLERTILSSADPPPHTLALAFCTQDPLAIFRDVTRPDDIGFASPFLTLRSPS